MVADAVLARHEDHRARHALGDAHRVVRGARVHRHERLAGRARRPPRAPRRPARRAASRAASGAAVLRRHAAPRGRRSANARDVARDAPEASSSTPRMSSENRTLAGDRVDEPRVDLDLADRADRPLPGGGREPLELEHRLGERRAAGRAGGPSASRRRGRPGPRRGRRRGRSRRSRSRPDPLARVLQNARLLDVHLDPAGEVVEHVDRLAPARRLVAGRLGGSQNERPSSIARNRSRRSSSVTRCAMIRLPSSIWPKPEPSSSRNETSWSGSPSPRSSFRRQTSSAVTTPIVPSYLPPLRFESQCEPIPKAGSPRGRLRATRFPTGSRSTVEADRLQLAGEVLQRAAVLRRVGVAADRLGRRRVVAARERLDVALDAGGARHAA